MRVGNYDCFHVERPMGRHGSSLPKAGDTFVCVGVEAGVVRAVIAARERQRHFVVDVYLVAEVRCLGVLVFAAYKDRVATADVVRLLPGARVYVVKS